MTPPPVNTYQRGADLAARDPPVALDREFEVTKKYAMAVKEVGEEEGLGVVDVWTKVWDKAGREECALSRYLWDGLHLNSAGYEVRQRLVDRDADIDLFPLRSCMMRFSTLSTRDAQNFIPIGSRWSSPRACFH
jgi:hypothetical protein